MTVRRMCQTVGGVLAIAAISAGVALASAPLPRTAKLYSTSGFRKRVSVSLVTSATNPRRILAGPAVPPIGSQFAISDEGILCPGVKRNPGAPKSLQPFMLFGLPGATLKLSHGAYGFTISRTFAKQVIEGSPVKAFKLTVKLTGTVSSPTVITGTMTAHGGPCALKDKVAFSAKLNNQVKVAPGQ